MRVLLFLLFPMWLSAQKVDHHLVFIHKDSFLLSGADTIIYQGAMVSPASVNWSSGDYCMCLHNKTYMVCDSIPAIVNFTIVPPSENYWLYEDGTFFYKK